MYRAGDIIVFDEHHQMVVHSTDPMIGAALQEIPYGTSSVQGSDVLVQLPWHEDSCKLIQNAGVDVTQAAPIYKAALPQVEGKYKPMAHQVFTAAFLTLNPRAYVLSDPRTGKTGALILAMDYMQRHRLLTGGVLIITTVTTMTGVWGDGIKTTLPDACVRIVHGKNRDALLEEPSDFYITNYDSCRLSCDAFCRAIDEGRIGAIVIDEMTHVGNPSSQRHKAIDAMANGKSYPKLHGLRKNKRMPQYVVGMTGSPGNNPETVYGMCRMINWSKLPCLTKSAWMDMVTYQYGPEPFQRRLSARAPEIIHAAMQPAVRFNKADIIDLPPVVTQDRECVLSPEQVKVRDQFKAQAVALMQSGETISAANGGVLYGKLMQTAQGFVMSNEGKPVYLDVTDRTKTIREVIDESSHKVVVFCVYRATIERLAKDLQAAHYTCGVVDGSITGAERAKLLGRFQNSATPHVLICHPTTTAFGVELSAADTIIFNGPPQLGGFIYAQALERLSSVKQTAQKISIVRIIASPEEKRAYKQLDNGAVAGNYISELFEDFSRGIL